MRVPNYDRHATTTLVKPQDKRLANLIVNSKTEAERKSNYMRLTRAISARYWISYKQKKKIRKASLMETCMSQEIDPITGIEEVIKKSFGVRYVSSIPENGIPVFKTFRPTTGTLSNAVAEPHKVTLDKQFLYLFQDKTHYFVCERIIKRPKTKEVFTEVQNLLNKN